jgi:hypothetical protein
VTYDPGGFDLGNPASFIRGLIEEGTGKTEGLDLYRSFGGEIRDSRWSTLYDQVLNLTENEPTVLGRDIFALPGPSDYDVLEAGTGGRFVTDVKVQMVDRETGLWTTRDYSHWTVDPHTPAEAEASAWAIFGDEDVMDNYGETMMGSVATSVYRTIPYGGP